jgi:tetratricopeptide (TPR) repeat protein
VSQETTNGQLPDPEFRHAAEVEQSGLYGQAILHYNRFLEQELLFPEPEYTLFREESELNAALASLRLDLPEAEALVINFIENHSPDPLAVQAAFAMADHHYRNRKYEKALQAFELLPSSGLTKTELNELQFKKGYAHFVMKDFAAARSAFDRTRNEKTRFYYPSNYYYGMCMFFEGDYDAALESFRQAEDSELYKDYVPYYFCKIYHAKGAYDQLITYGEKALARNPENSNDIRLLLGQAYYEKDDFTHALPYLRAYEASTETMREQEFYQLGFAEYIEGNYDKAIPHFREILDQESPAGAMARFYLGKTYLQTGDKQAARLAFEAAGKSGLDESLKEESLFLYGQLSAELNFHTDAIRALEAVPAYSTYYREAQDQLAGVFLNTRDFEQSIRLLEAKENLSPTLQKAYQQLCLFRGIQLFNDGLLSEANTFFNKALSLPIQREIRAQCLFWKAEIAYRSLQYKESIDLGSQYLTLARSDIQLPPEASEPLAHYRQGYNYLKLNRLSSAEEHFRQAIEGIRFGPVTYPRAGFVTERILPDAIIRTGDCLFKRNRYDDALKFYHQASSEKMFGYAYALFQEAMILGLQNKHVDKIVVLDELINDKSRSEFTDDALFQKAVTFLEIQRGEKAIEPLHKLIGNFPHSELYNAALLRLGLISYNNGDMQSAIEYYKQVLDNNPSQLEIRDALTALEEIYVHDLSKPDAYFTMLETMPGLSVPELRKDSIRFRTAEIQYEDGKYRNAIEGYTEYLYHYPNGTYKLQALFHRAESATQLQSYTEALTDYREIISAGETPYRLRAIEKAAVISYHHSKDFKAAYELYDKLAREASDDNTVFEASFGALRSAYRSGNGDAVIRYADILETNSRLTPDQESELHYYAGKEAIASESYDEAIRHFNELIRNTSDAKAAEARYLIARIYYLRGQLELAEQLCQNTMRQSANYPLWVARSLILLSDIFVAREEYFSAKAPLEALLEHFRDDEEIRQEAIEKLEKIREIETSKSRIEQDTGKYLKLDYSNDR